MAEIMTNTYDIDKAAYQQEQTLFLNDQAAFRTGSVGAGVYALGHLKSMYRLLWYRKHRVKAKDSSDSYMNLLNTVEEKIFDYAKKHTDKAQQELVFLKGFRDLIKDFDLVTERYQQIIIECEVKP